MPIEQGAARGGEAQIEVHWKEEAYLLPSPQFIGQANLVDAAVLDRFKEEHFPECFREYADLLDWNQYWHTTLDTSDPPVLEMVRRRNTQRLLQLCRPASAQVQEQGGADLRSRT